MQGLATNAFVATGLYHPFGEDGKAVQCYGLDLDGFYVTTPNRYADPSNHCRYIVQYALYKGCTIAAWPMQ